MNREIADKWTAALRSGQYSQTDGCLKRRWEDGSCSYCALGVLVDLFKKEHPDEVLEDVGAEGTVTYTIGHDGHTQELPERVVKWAGSWDQHGRFNRGFFTVPCKKTQNRAGYWGGSTTSVSDANDLGLDFSEIADLIDEYKDTM